VLRVPLAVPLPVRVAAAAVNEQCGVQWNRPAVDHDILPKKHWLWHSQWHPSQTPVPPNGTPIPPVDLLGRQHTPRLSSRWTHFKVLQRKASMATELTWLGHACWLVDTDGHAILIDPFLNDSPTAPIKADNARANFILVSHGHFDHVADAARIANRTGATVVSNFEICEWLGKQKVKNTEPMNIGGSIELPFGQVKLTIAHHSSVLPDGASGGNPSGFLLTLAKHKLYFACDTGLFYDMKLIGAAGLDLAVLPIGDRFTMGPDDALEAVKLLAPRRVVPSHFNTWPPIAQDAARWAERVRAETKTEPIVVPPGGKISLE